MQRTTVGVLVVAGISATGLILTSLAGPAKTTAPTTKAKPKSGVTKQGVTKPGAPTAKTHLAQGSGKSTAANGHWAPAVQPKPLSENVEKGLSWLVAHQLPSGAWGQGDESENMGSRNSQQNNLATTANVADTCVATLSLLRAGHTPSKGRYAKHVRSAINYICDEIEKSDEKTLYVTSVRGTRVQAKLGPFIDTFLSSLVLAEVKGHMGDSDADQRVAKAFDKVMDKIEKNQRPDGTWDSQGWAPALSQSMASKALNRAAQTPGAKVNEEVRQRAELYSRNQMDRKTGAFGPAGSAGVALYAGAANLGAMNDSNNTNSIREQKLRDDLKKAKTEPERAAVKKDLDAIESSRSDLRQARAALSSQLNDEKFIKGFGSNGGEEFLSYMNIGESLVVNGGEEWQKWDKSITENLNRIQNGDGSWSGHHCITGRTFCTAAALLTLTVDRAPVPVAGKIKKG